MKLILLFFSVFTAAYADEPLKNHQLPVNKMNLCHRIVERIVYDF
jgi:hypothetical protein